MKKFYVGVKGIVHDAKHGYILLHRKSNSGEYWDTPGGRMDEGEAFEDTLRRELAEELPGIDVESVGELVGAHRLLKDIDGDMGLVLLYFLVEAHLPEQIALSEEHQDYTWVRSLDKIPAGANDQLRKILQSLL